jgi:ribonuclease BN (tRNA processing enzyme)
MNEPNDLSQTGVFRLKDFQGSGFKLTFLGSGSAFTVGDDNYQSNLLLEAPSGKKLLIDCGSDVRFPLHKLGIKPTELDAVYISHLHADHIGGLEWLAFSTKFAPNAVRPKLIASESLIQPLWATSLSGGLGSLEGVIATLDTFFEPYPVDKAGRFTWENIPFQMVQVVHFFDGFKFSPSFGLMFKIGGKMIFFTTDTQFAPNQLSKFLGMSDLIFHDCETGFKSGVHAHYTDLVKLPAELKAKMWLYHYQPKPTQDPIADGFLGFVKQGQVFNF